jgi:hypothetical protein
LVIIPSEQTLPVEPATEVAHDREQLLHDYPLVHHYRKQFLVDFKPLEGIEDAGGESLALLLQLIEHDIDEGDPDIAQKVPGDMGHALEVEVN